MRERTQVRTILKEVRAHLPDALMTLREIPRIVQTAVREAAQGGLPAVECAAVAQLRADMRRSARRRELGWIAAVVWLSGLICLTQTTQYRWLGWLQLIAAVMFLVRMRTLKLRIA
jgi:hypothetical protein